MYNNNKPLIISLAVNVLLLLLLGAACVVAVTESRRQCPPVEASTVIEYRDSIVYRRDTTAHTILRGAPKLTKHTPAAQPAAPCDPVYLAQQESCADSNFYCKDTAVPNQYKASASAIVTGNKLVSLDISYADLHPDTMRIKEVTTTVVEHPRSPLFKVYAGAFGMGRKDYWGLGLKADLVIQDKYMVGFGFDAKNQSYQAELLYKLSFIK